MTRFRFPQSSFVGFDTFLDELNYALDHSEDSYPPHNIVKLADDHFQIELAVAGFSEDELDVIEKERTLTITGNHVSRNRDFVHKGISTKKFKRTFRLSEYVEVTGAEYRNGLLVINLKVVIPEKMQPRHIKITNSNIDRGD